MDKWSEKIEIRSSYLKFLELIYCNKIEYLNYDKLQILIIKISNLRLNKIY